MENEVVAPDTIDPTPPEPEIKVEPTEVKVEPKAEPQSRSDVIREALKKDAKEPREPKAERAAKFPTPDSKQEKPVVHVPEMPKSLKVEMKAHWEKAPPELRQAIAQREADFERGINTYKSRDAEAKAITELFQPYEWMLRNENATPATAIAPLLQTAALLRTGTPQQKSQAVAQMIQQFQIPLDQVAAHFGGQPPVQDNHYNQLAQQVQQLTQHITQSQYEAQKQNESRALSVIQQFAADPANAHFEAVQDRMLSLLQAPHVLGDTGNMSEREKLQLAYDTAIRLDPSLSQQIFAQQQQSLQAQSQAQRAKAAAVQVKGSPGSVMNAALNQTDRRAIIANALRSANY
jgi:Arc/MetJ-type ribon-helix-helix transcriptional regulator